MHFLFTQPVKADGCHPALPAVVATQPVDQNCICQGKSHILGLCDHSRGGWGIKRKGNNVSLVGSSSFSGWVLVVCFFTFSGMYKQVQLVSLVDNWKSAIFHLAFCVQVSPATMCLLNTLKRHPVLLLCLKVIHACLIYVIPIYWLSCTMTSCSICTT